MKSFIFTALIFGSLACFNQNINNPMTMYIDSPNKSLVLSFYQRVIGQRDADYAKQIIKEHYIQHNPNVKTGLVGILETLEFLKQIPQPKNPPKPFMRIFADGDFAIVHMEVEVMGQKKAVMDIFRIEDGQLAEHWDAIQDIPTSSINDNPMVRGISKVDDLELTNKNKKILKKYAEDILLKRDHKNIAQYISPKLIQHNPTIKNGLPSLLEYYNNVEFQKIHRVIGEGNFVCVQSSGLLEKIPHVMYDLFRLEEGQIIEHWSVSQEIPEKMAHGNGMI